MNIYSYHDVNYRGQLVRVNYTTVDDQGQPAEKYANVYLPYGYDENDSEKKYNVLYLMHGGGGNPDAWIDCTQLKNMLDDMICNGEIQPLIVVFPSYYNYILKRTGGPDRDKESFLTKFFQTELHADLIPAIESRFHTYAEEVTPEGLKASRMHRGFGGFSMGACTTWYALTHNLDYISTFLPLSGDCWEVEPMGGKSKPEETARLLHDRVAASGYSADEYVIYAATGANDIAYEALTAQVDAMKEFTDTFCLGKDLTEGNFYYLLDPDEVHRYEAVAQYLYNFLPYLFRN